MIERIANGRTDLVIDLVHRGAPATLEDPDGTSLIQWCAYYGDVSSIRFLLDHGEKLASLGADLGLIGAAFHGHWRLVEYLLENGADANRAAGDTGETPLHAALVKANRPSVDLVVRVLLDRGASPNAKTKPGIPTGSFMRDGRTKGETPLHRAAAFGTVETIRALIDAGAQVDAKDMNGDSPLAWASWHLRPDAVLKLLCYDGHKIHPQRDSAYDHGRGWGTMDASLLGRPSK